MSRRSTKQTRLDSMSQFGRRKFLKKNSPQGKHDAKDWTTSVLQRLENEMAKPEEKRKR